LELHKNLGISSVAEQILASQEGLVSMESVGLSRGRGELVKIFLNRHVMKKAYSSNYSDRNV
jgi:hypothetical protein